MGGGGGEGLRKHEVFPCVSLELLNQVEGFRKVGDTDLDGQYAHPTGLTRRYTIGITERYNVSRGM